MNYYDVKEKLPPIGKIVKVFWEQWTSGGHGIWWQGSRVSDTHFEIGNNRLLVLADTSNRTTLGLGITHWADLEANDLPNLCRRITCCALVGNGA